MMNKAISLILEYTIYRGYLLSFKILQYASKKITGSNVNMYKDFILCKYEEKKDISKIEKLGKQFIYVVYLIITIIVVLEIILGICCNSIEILSFHIKFIIRSSFILLIALLLFKQTHILRAVYMRFDENKNIILFEIDEENNEKIVEIIKEDEIKDFTYKNFCGHLCINFYKRKPIEISLEHLEKETQSYLANTIIHNYKITPKVVEKILKPHQIGTNKNVYILIIIGILIVIAIIVSALK